MREASLIPWVERFMRRQGYESCRQVPLGTKRIDLLCYRPDMTEMVAIEFKVSNWRRGFEQALTRRLCADKVYLALPKCGVNGVDQELLLRYGVGLMVIGSDVKIAIEASCSNKIHSTLREQVVVFLRSQKQR